MSSRWRVAIAALFLAGASVPAFAQGPGVQVGVSGDPSQFYFGGQYELGTGIDRLWFRPNVEVGVGDNVTLVGFNFEFAYRMPLPHTDWRLYFGAGPALNVTRVHSDSTTGGGFNMLIGVSHWKGLFTELKVGFVDSPSVRFGVGYTF
jgi:hypothetical protein